MTVLGTVLTILDWNARCGKPGTLTSLMKKTPTIYRDEHQRYGADLTPDNRHQRHTGTNKKKMVRI